MATHNHSVLLDISKCKGCTHCLKRCPTEAIRIRDGHAQIDASRCIDCGMCIRLCPYKAKKATCDKLDTIFDYRYKIALPPPTLYGQFDHLDDIDYLIQGLLDFGFDEVFEVARAAEIVSGYTRRYMQRPDVVKPAISSACPAVCRLIEQRFPDLIDNVLPLLPPVDVAAMMAREEALKNHPELKPEDIGVCFISPCPAKVSYIKSAIVRGESNIDCVVSVSDIYFALVGIMDGSVLPRVSAQTGIIGVSWASTGGEAGALFNDRYLAADGIENVIHVLENIENGSFPDLEFIELGACAGGCVGGVMTVENPFIAKARLQTVRHYLPVCRNWSLNDDARGDISIPATHFTNEPLEYRPMSSLSGDRMEAFRKRAQIQQIVERLPALDCGSCGSPTCQAFAEDVVNGLATEDECIVNLRDRFQDLLGGTK